MNLSELNTAHPALKRGAAAGKHTQRDFTERQKN